jgi:hypothetical protein
MIVANHVRRVPRSLILHARREPRQHRARVAVERVERDRRRRFDRLERRARPRILAAPRREIALVEIMPRALTYAPTGEGEGKRFELHALAGARDVAPLTAANRAWHVDAWGGAPRAV